MQASSATTSFQSLLASQAASQAGDVAADPRKQALEEQARSEAAAILDKIKSDAISTAPALVGKTSSSGKKADADPESSDAASGKGAPTATTHGPSMELVTYASVTKAYAAQAAHGSA